MKQKLMLLAVLLSTVGGFLLTVAEAQRRGTTAPSFPPGERERVLSLGSRGVRVHDPSTIIKEKDQYWIFYTGNGVPSYRSKDLITWEQGPRIFAANPPWLAQVVPPGTGRRGGPASNPANAPTTGPTTAAARGRGRGAGAGVASFWAPDVIKVGEQYMVFFSYSAFGRNTSAIAVATSPTLDPDDPKYKWTDQGIIVQSRTEDDFNAIDPAVQLDTEGNLWMAFGSFWSGIKLIQLDPKTGKRVSPDAPMYTLAHYGSIEAAEIYAHDGQYYLILDWGLCCRGTDSTYEMRVGRSRKITGPYLDKEGKDMLTGGGSPLLATDGGFIGPGHAGIFEENGKTYVSMHFYDGTAGQGGTGGTLAIRPLTWDAEGWPVIGKP